ncbi:MAG TPA: alpha-xylosidase, partial [Vicinamibacteria bacterium]|nr:alpha-xylosidase [Vicinamibacteria bacterium]
MISRRLLAGLLLALAPWPALAQPANTPPPLLSDLVDVSPDFRDYRNAYYLADSLAGFDPAAGTGSLTWRRHQLYPRIAFDNMEAVLRPFDGVVFPDREYATNPALPFEIRFVSPRTVRLRLRTGPRARPEGDSLMLVREPNRDPSWVPARIEGGYRFASAAGSVTVLEQPWHVE